MQIQVLFFGITRDLVGKSLLDLTIAENSSVNNLKQQLIEEHSELNSYNFSVAVNEAYAEDDTILKEKDIVALIPPVSGG